MPEVHDQKERVLSVEEEKRLLGAVTEDYKDIILFALNTGMRLGEILGLKWEWADLEESLINLPQTHTKSKRSRKVPVNPVTRRILLERKLKSGGEEFIFKRESYYSLLGKLRRSFKEACNRAGITDLRFHDLRHTVGTRLGEEGVPIQTISKPLRHTSTRMTERYVHPEESVKKATDILAHFSNSVTDKLTDKEESQ
ncbi:MAG: site-specific integrase [Deltaproteobacteria bacterium]|nr:site-specific integrase [Deltaproteobacteria bacterium]